MNHEKIFKREDGSKVNIQISFWTNSISNEFSYRVSVSICQPKKRTWIWVNDADNYTWRRLSNEERDAYDMKNNLRFVTKAEIQEVSLELWNKIKPKF